MTTDAVVFTRVGEVALQSVPVPEPGPGEVQIRTRHSAISAGTEGWQLQYELEYPMIPGYQRMGTIVAVGPGVEEWNIGDAVVATTSTRHGGPVPRFGAHIGLANTPVAEVFRIPNGVDPVDASAAVVAQVGYNAADRVAMSPGDCVLVFGDGVIGHVSAQAARARGARTILAGHRAERLALAAEHSVDHVLDDRDERFLEQVRDIAGAETVTAVIDTIQTDALRQRYADLLERSHGQIVLAGGGGNGAATADLTLLQDRELTTHGISGWTRERMDATLALLADGSLRVRPLVTHRVEPEAATDVWGMILGNAEPHLGVVFDWDESEDSR